MNTNTNSQLPQEFNSLIEVIEYFTDEKKCLNYLLAQRFDGAIVCPHCGGSKVYCFSDGIRFKCSSCRQQFTAKVGTIFEGSKIPMKKWFTAIYLVTSHKKGISSHQLAKDIKVTQKSAWFMLHRIRFALGQGSFEAPMGGGGGIIEIDETYVGGKLTNMHTKKKQSAKNNPNHNKTIVIGMVERGGDIRTMVIPNTHVDTMQNLIAENIDTDAQLITDSHQSYKGLYQIYDKHKMVKGVDGYTTTGKWHTNNIEGYWSLLKRSIIGIYHYVSPKHLQAYCDESAYRYNTRTTNEGNRVALTISKANGRRLTYNTLIAK
jgi:transposase-like protein